MQPTRFEIPEQMRQVAEETVGQARKAVEEFLDATQKAVVTAEGSAKTMGEGVADLSRQSLAFIEQNIGLVQTRGASGSGSHRRGDDGPAAGIPAEPNGRGGRAGQGARHDGQPRCRRFGQATGQEIVSFCRTNGAVQN